MKNMISDTEISVRVRNCLREMGVTAWEEVAVKTPGWLVNYHRNFGLKSLNEVHEILHALAIAHSW